MNWTTFFTFLGYHWRYHAALIASWLIPRSKKIWVVGGSKGLRFADNARHFALQARRNWPKQTIIWISPSAEVRAQAIEAGIMSFHPTSMKGLWYGFRADWHIFDVSFTDIHRFSGIGAKWLNLWHGVPLKSLDNIKPWQSKDIQSRLHDWWYRKNSQHHKKYLAYPTQAHFKYMSMVLELPLENVIAANLPRNQQLLDAACPYLSSEELQLRQQLKQTGKTLIGYFPTWRDTGMDKFMGAASTEDINALNALLEKYNALLITKWHSCSYVEYQHRGVSQTAAEINQTLAQSSHIMALSFLCDLNTVLDCCSMLISDYSGVLIDYLLLQRPIIQIPYDQEEYKNFTGVLPDYEQFSTEAGPLTKSFSQLLNQLERYLSHSDDWEKEYKLRQENLENYYFSTKESMTKLEHLLQPVQ